MSPQRHLDRLRAPVVVTLLARTRSPEFQRQARDFAAAIKAAGKSVELIEAPNYNHYEMGESFGNAYGRSGRAAVALITLLELDFLPPTQRDNNLRPSRTTLTLTARRALAAFQKGGQWLILPPALPRVGRGLVARSLFRGGRS